jgi:putative SOS response-associated peptidase YedK
MCNLYSITKGQAAIGAFTRAMRDLTGNLPPMPGVFPDYPAPIVRNAPDGVRELMLARWGMPGPPQFGGAPITNIRNTASPHWRAWLSIEHRCVVPFNSFCEYANSGHCRGGCRLQADRSVQCGSGGSHFGEPQRHSNCFYGHQHAGEHGRDEARGLHP